MPSFRKEKPANKQEGQVPVEARIGDIKKKFVNGYPVPHIYMGDGMWVQVDALGENQGFEQGRRSVIDHPGYKEYSEKLNARLASDSTSDLDVDDAKLYMWENVICMPTGVKRMVARVHNWESDDSRGGAVPDEGKYELFVPNSWDDRYELVTTLGTDGNTYPVYDIDSPLNAFPYHMWDECLFVPSTNNWHGFEQTPTWWTSFLKKHKEVLPDNDGYLAMNREKGWAGVRPPWARKDWETFDESAASISMNWINFRAPDRSQGNSDDTKEKPMSLAEMFETV